MLGQTTKNINLLLETNTLIKHINELGRRYDYFDSTFSKQFLLDKVLKYKFDLHLQENGLTICGLDVYACLIECMHKLITNCSVSFDKSKIYIRYCNHRHKYTPTQAYAGVALELSDKDSKEPFFYFMLSPYIGEFNIVEVGLSVKSSDLRGSLLLKNYNEVFEHIKPTIPITNLSPANLYLYVLLSKAYGVTLSESCENYKTEFTNLQNYTQKINGLYPELCLVLDENGGFSWNKKFKLKQIVAESRDLVPFPDLSSFLYEKK